MRLRKRVPRSALVIAIVTLVMLVIAGAAFGWTRYRYGSGYTTAGFNDDAATSGSLNREYNDVYHNTNDEWIARYYNGTTVTAEVYSYSSPTHLGATSGPRTSYCYLYDPNSNNTAWNCDTTVP